MRSNNPRNDKSHCPRCYQHREICVCPILPTVITKTEFLILRHVWEAHRPSNTGRLVTLAMPNARIIPCGGGTRVGASAMDEGLFKASGTWLLWPDGSELRTNLSGKTPPVRLVVIDATWQQARRLLATIPALTTLPRLALPSPVRHKDRLRKQHRPDGMSTIEAVAAAVAQLESAEKAKLLEDLYDELVRRVTGLRWGDVRKKTPEE